MNYNISRGLILLVSLAMLGACAGPVPEQQIEADPVKSEPSSTAVPTVVPTQKPTPAPTSTPLPPTPVIAMSPPNPGGGSMMSGLQGTLIREGTCLYIDSDHGGRWIPVFPFDSATWLDGALVANGQEFKPGDPIAVGGGERFWQSPTGLSQDPSAECQTTKLWISSPNIRTPTD